MTNDTLTMMYNTSGLELQLTNLQHSTSYTVSLVAVNVFGSSQPAVVGVFRTSDTGECKHLFMYHVWQCSISLCNCPIFHLVPIIHNITSKALSLSSITVSIVFQTNGGQNVQSITVRLTMFKDFIYVYYYYV